MRSELQGIEDRLQGGQRKKALRGEQYPPDKQEKAMWTVLEQAEMLSEGWVM